MWVLDVIPDPLRPPAEAALAWFNEREGAVYELTGIIDPPEAASDPSSLRLILCGEGICRQERFRVRARAEGWEVEWLEGGEPNPTKTAALDPPPGPRRGWIDQVTARHRFVVLIFYRGFW